MFRGACIEGEGEPAKFRGIGCAKHTLSCRERDVLVVRSILALGGRGENRRWEPRSVQKPFRKGNAAKGSAVAIFLPAGTGKVAASDAFHGKHCGTFHQHRTSFKLICIRLQCLRKVGDAGCDQMIGDKVREQIEPEERNLCENLPFARNPGCQNMVEGGDAVRCHQQQRIVNCVKIPHFAAAKQRYIAQICSEESGHGEACLGGY